jgi:PTH2 family peptidyl-tRNA hydrolase
MDAGKIGSQAGHAYLGAFINPANDPAILAEYHKDYPASPGTKICLACKNLPALLRAEAEAIEASIPSFKVIDFGCPNFFGGRPIVTALGIGPATRDQIQHITKRFQLMK